MKQRIGSRSLHIPWRVKSSKSDGKVSVPGGGVHGQCSRASKQRFKRAIFEVFFRRLCDQDRISLFQWVRMRYRALTRPVYINQKSFLDI